MFRSLFSTAKALVGIAWLAAAAAGEVRQWELGGAGRSWQDDELNSTAISFDVAGAIQLVGFNPSDNIVPAAKMDRGLSLGLHQ